MEENMISKYQEVSLEYFRNKNEERLLNYLERLLIEKNDFCDENHEYQLKSIKDIYFDILNTVGSKLKRLPTLGEIIYKVFDFNYDIILKIAEQDINGWFGNLGYAYYTEKEFELTDDEYLDIIFYQWQDSLTLDLGWNISEHIDKLLSELNLSYIDDTFTRFRDSNNFRLTMYRNDCQNTLLPNFYLSMFKNQILLDEDVAKILHLNFTENLAESPRL